MLALIERFPGYVFDGKGIIWSRRKTHGFGDRWRQMSQTPSTGGYLKCQLIDATGKQRNCYVHRLMLEAFVGECPPGLQCRHLNGCRQDNRRTNLKWGTPKENHRDRAEHGNGLHGESNGLSKLTDREAVVIRELLRRGSATQKRIAEWFGVSANIVCRIVRRQTRKHI